MRLDYYSDALPLRDVTDYMTKKNLLLFLLVAGLALVYAIWFTDWFQTKTVHISSTSRNLRANQSDGPGGNLIFVLRPEARLKEIKVVALDALNTNKDAVPVWHMVSESNSVPLKIFTYGQHINGMHAALKGVRPEPLETNVTYRMFITAAGKIKGQHDFIVK